jgi:hypothetical protein
MTGQISATANSRQCPGTLDARNIRSAAGR